MSAVKVIELMAQGPSIEEAVESALNEARSSVRNISEIWIKDINANVEDGKIVTYRVNTKISFVVEK